MSFERKIGSKKALGIGKTPYCFMGLSEFAGKNEIKMYSDRYQYLEKISLFPVILLPKEWSIDEAMEYFIETYLGSKLLSPLYSKPPLDFILAGFHDIYSRDREDSGHFIIFRYDIKKWGDYKIEDLKVVSGYLKNIKISDFSDRKY